MPSVVASLVLISYTSSDADTAPSGTCSLVAGTCVAPSGMCCEQAATLFDETRGCLTKTPVTIGCAPSPISKDSACVDLGIVGCAITNDGGMRRVWFLSSRAIGAVGWSSSEACSDGMMKKVATAPRCPDDAGP